MNFVVTPISMILFTGGLVCLGLAVVILHRRTAPGALPLMLVLISAAFYTIPSAFDAAVTELTTRILCIKISYIGTVTTGVLWLIFTLDYTGSNWWKRPRNLILISILPVITLLIAWTNELHHLLWANVYLVNGPLGLTSLGSWAVVYSKSIYQYSLMACGIVILCRFGFRKPRSNLNKSCLSWRT
jgi:hypothetical protein